MYTQINVRKTKKISEVPAIAAFAILFIDAADTIIAQGRYGFLQLSDIQRGIAVGIPSIILFFISFGLIAGGALLAVFKLVAPTMGLDLYLAIALRTLYIALIT